MHKPSTTPNAPTTSLPNDPAAQSGNVQQLRPAGTSKGPSARVPFDPSTTLIRMPELLAITGIGGRATVYKLLKEDPTFPKPVPLSGSTARGAPVGFVLGEVQDWIRARIAARGEAA